VAGYRGATFVLGRGVETELVTGEYVTGDYFTVLGIRPLLGRLLLRSDDVVPGGHPVAVLSHSLWAARFGSNPEVVGQTVEIGTRPYEIVGVAPQGFVGPDATGNAPAIWVPTMQISIYGGARLFDEWGASWIQVVGRLADGVTFQESESSMQVVSTRLREANSINQDMVVLLAQGVGLDPRGRREARQLSLILFSIVGVVLLLACTNVANLFLARATGRQTEVAVRFALGAGRTRMVRQLLTESFLLSCVSTLIAMPVVLYADDLLPLVFPTTLAVSVGPDLQVVAFLVAVGLAAGLLFGLAPAWTVSRKSVIAALKDGATAGGRVRTRMRDVLVIAQLGLSLALVSGAALLGRSVMNAASAEPGFSPTGLTAAFIDLAPTGRYDEETGTELWLRLIDAVEAIPGVDVATIANQAPIAGGHSRRTVSPLGRDDVSFEAEYTVVGAEYFQVLGIPVVAGRALRGFHEETERVVVVNRALANMFWPGEAPIGKQLSADPPWRVVGVSGDVQMRSLRAFPNPAVYYPVPQEYDEHMALHIRAEPGRSITARSIREAVSSVDPELPVSRIVDMQEALTASMGETRTVGYLIGAFAVLSVVLASVGLYGLISYAASLRIRELGIRVALGAEPGSLVLLILARGLPIVAIGIVAGLAISYALARALRGLLFGVAADDVVTFGAAALCLLTTASIAAWFPARRASRLDAAVSLRQE
jgi:predicted permease